MGSSVTAPRQRSTRMARYAIPSGSRNRRLHERHQGARQDDRSQSSISPTALWETGVYEARMLASFVDDPARVTAAQMDRWCRDFDNWALCDALSFNLFDRTPHAWAKVTSWSTRRREVREAHGLCAAMEPHRARQGRRRRTVPQRPGHHRARRRRRSPFRQEGGQHGAASDRQTQSRAASRRARGRQTPGRLAPAGGTLGGNRRAA